MIIFKFIKIISNIGLTILGLFILYVVGILLAAKIALVSGMIK